MRFVSYSETELIQAIQESKSYNDVCKKLNITTYSNNKIRIKTYIKNNNIDISHFYISQGTTWIKGKNLGPKHNISYYLVKNGPNINSSDLRKKLIKENILENKCCICQLNSWQGKDLTLHLDHINGDHYDNSLENLRILCPNCHSQCETSTRQKTKHYCECGNEKYKLAKNCGDCYKISQKQKSNKPNKKILETLIKTENLEYIAKKFNVSGNTIRKWLKSYNLPYKKYDIKRCYAK